MSAPRKTTMNIRGLVTTPNEYGVYPEGSCARIQNLLARAANQWECARDVVLIRDYAFTTDYFAKLIGVGLDAVAAFVTDPAGSLWRVFKNGIFAQEYIISAPLDNSGLFDRLRLTPFMARNRLYANGLQGVVVFDTPAAAGSIARAAGLPQLIYEGISNVDVGGTPAGVTYTYAAIARRVAADGYTITSPPSVAFRYSDGGSPEFEFGWGNIEDFQVGDVVELYRSAGISGLNPVTDTGTSMRLVASHVINAADRAAFFVRVQDLQPSAAPLYETDGLEIYTSPYRDGATGANLPPPVCKTIAQWGDYTFFGNITDDPTFVFDVPGGMIWQFYGAPAPGERRNAVGDRQLTGTRTSGSPTITAVSAADIVGVSPGQHFGGTGIGTNARVVSVGASTITLSVNSTSSGTSVCACTDVLEVNGTEILLTQYMNLVRVLGTQLGRVFAFYPSETLPLNGSAHQYGTTVVVRPNRSGLMPTITVRATNGQNYSPPLPQLAQTVKTIGRTERPNFLRWSRSNQPEAVPAGNESVVGNGEIIRLLPATDCLWVLCTDGAYRLSGSGGVWRTDLVDQSFVPIGPDACCVLNDIVYAYTPRGIASLNGTQVTLLTKGVLDAEFPVRSYGDTQMRLYANPATEEIIVVREVAPLGASSSIHVYSTLYQQWSTYRPTRDSLTSFAMSQPVSTFDAPFVVFGTFNGNRASLHSWRSDSGPLLDGDLLTQPFYAGDPLTQKRWIDATWVIAQREGSRATQRVNGTPGSASGVADFKTTQVDSRANMGIIRSTAIGPAMRLGVTLTHVSGTAPIVLKGASLRFLPLTTQQRSR